MKPNLACVRRAEVRGLIRGVVLLSAMSWGAMAQAQEPVKVLVGRDGKPVPAAVKQIMDWLTESRFEECIEKTTLALSDPATADPRMRYWRGYAYRAVGRFDDAVRDFELLGDFTAWPPHPPASQAVAQLRATIALRPPNEEVVRVGDKVVFRVYYGEKSAFTRTILAALLKGYGAASTFLEKDTEEVPVFVFTKAEYPQFIQFFTAYSGPPRSYYRAIAPHESIVISQRNALGQVYDSYTTELPYIIGHEMAHILLRRTVGGLKDLPTWFDEGQATMVGLAHNPRGDSANDVKVQRLLREGNMLPLEQVSNPIKFYEIVGQHEEGESGGDPYPQGHNMTRYLGRLLKGEKLGTFLLLVREKGSFAAAVKQSTGLTMPEFYESWLQSVKDAAVN